MTLHPVHRQEIHEQRQQDDPNHDRSSCVCCCDDCTDLFAQKIDTIDMEE